MSPLPVVSTNSSIEIGSILCSTLFSNTTDPFEPRVIAPKSTLFLIVFMLCAKFDLYKLSISCSFAKIIST